MHGLSFLPLLKEPLFLVGPASMPAPARAGAAAPICARSSSSCRAPTTWCASWSTRPSCGAGMVPRVVAEIESAFTLTAAIADGLGATILPASMAREVVAACGAWQFRIVDPVIEAPLALCQSDHLPLSEPAQAVKDILLELVADLAGNRRRRRPNPSSRPVISRPYRGTANPSWALRPAVPSCRYVFAERRPRSRRARHEPGTDQDAHRRAGGIGPRRAGVQRGRLHAAAGEAVGAGAVAPRAPARDAAPRGRREPARRDPRSAGRCRAECLAPLYGVVHLQPSPGEPPFVQAGQAVKAGQTLCVIEAMKVFNEVRAERDATVAGGAGRARARKSKPASPCSASAEKATMFDTVLIANRGEIALAHPARLPRPRASRPWSCTPRPTATRVLRAQADQALCIGPAAPGAELPEPGGDPVRRRGQRRAGHPSGLRLPVGERGLRRARRAGRPDLHRPERRLHPHDGRQGRGQARDAARRRALRAGAGRRPAGRSGGGPRAGARDRLPGDRQGRGRRRRPRHARGARRGARCSTRWR